MNKIPTRVRCVLAAAAYPVMIALVIIEAVYTNTVDYFGTLYEAWSESRIIK